MKELKVLIILENCFMSRPGLLTVPAYGIDECNTSNATFSRVLKHFKNTPFTPYFGETTPHIATNNKQKFPVDLNWVKKTLEYDDWFAVIACCKKAEIACNEIGFKPFVNLPHPASWAWRKNMMIDCITELKTKL